MSLPIDQPSGLVPLDRVPEHTCGVVAFLSAPDDDVTRLKAMGVCLGRQVEVLQSGDPLIVRAYRSRIGISSRVARHVYVDLCAQRVAAAATDGDVPAS